jgi:hypothetical protein
VPEQGLQLPFGPCAWKLTLRAFVIALRTPSLLCQVMLALSFLKSYSDMGKVGRRGGTSACRGCARAPDGAAAA